MSREECERCGNPFRSSTSFVFEEPIVISLPNGEQLTRLCFECFHEIDLGVFVRAPTGHCRACGHLLDDVISACPLGAARCCLMV